MEVNLKSSVANCVSARPKVWGLAQWVYIIGMIILALIIPMLWCWIFHRKLWAQNIFCGVQSICSQWSLRRRIRKICESLSVPINRLVASEDTSWCAPVFVWRRCSFREQAERTVISDKRIVCSERRKEEREYWYWLLWVIIHGFCLPFIVFHRLIPYRA